MKYTTLFFIILLMAGNCLAQSEIEDLQEVEVTSSRVPLLYSESSRIIEVISKEEIRFAPVSSIGELLDFVAGIDIRQRGVDGVQADISLRGGSFEQCLVLLNGIPWNDPQTGHHNLDLPVNLQGVERIEILEGPGSRIYGPNAFSGAINIITQKGDKNKLKLNLEAGENEYLNAGLGASFSNKKSSHFISFNNKTSGGYIKNTDYELSNIFASSSINFGKSKLSIQAGMQNKAFGANAFYSAKYPDQYEKTQTQFASIKFSTGDKIKFTPYVYWKKHQDNFDLFRYAEASWYAGNNFHMTNVGGGGFNSWFISRLGKTSFGIDFNTNKIWSNVLGEPTENTKPVPGEDNIDFDHSASRNNTSIFVEHNFYLGKLNISGGILSNYNSEFDWSVFPGLDLSYALNKKIKIFASINQSLRLPTYTDLYYVGPTNIGNPDLKPEKSTTVEGGIKFVQKAFRASFALFHRQGSDIIDWVKPNDTAKWESQNITEINTNGLEISFFLNGRKAFGKNSILQQLRLSYCYIDMNKTSRDFISKYALDQLRHKASLSLQHKIYHNIGMSWLMSWQDRNGSYLDFESNAEKDYKPYFLADARLFWQNKNFRIYVEASNILDTKHFDLGNIVMPGRWIRAGLTYQLEF
jgi:vitamin B12 transporter